MTNRYLSYRIKSILYSLQRQYGDAISVYQPGTSSVDALTGNRTTDVTSIDIKRAIILPARILPKTAQTISVISANKQFVMGGHYDSSTRIFIIDRAKQDVANLVLKEQDWIVYQNKKYEIEVIGEFEFDSAWVVTAKAVLGDIPEKIFNVGGEDFIRLRQSIGPDTFDVIHGIDNILHNSNEVIYNA